MELKEISIQELRTKAEKETVQVIDIRPTLLFQNGHVHIKHLIHIPFQELGSRLEELNKQKPVYVICSHGVSSKIGAAYLASKGFDAYSVEEGTMGWKEKYPSEVN